MDRRIWAALPVKALSSAKRRLSDYLLPAERRTLVLMLLEWSASALRPHLPTDHIVVVSPDSDVLQWARERGLGSQQQRGIGLNCAIREVEGEAIRAGCDVFMVVLPDLPLFTSNDVQQLLDRLSASRHAVIGMGQRGGTHALAIRPPGWLEFAFGASSYRRHLAVVGAADATLSVYESPGVYFDLDTPEDLAMAKQMRPELRLLGHDMKDGVSLPLHSAD